jgi:hypothetical protein
MTRREPSHTADWGTVRFLLSGAAILTGVWAIAALLRRYVLLPAELGSAGGWEWLPSALVGLTYIFAPVGAVCYLLWALYETRNTRWLRPWTQLLAASPIAFTSAGILAFGWYSADQRRVEYYDAAIELCVAFYHEAWDGGNDGEIPESVARICDRFDADAYL